MFTPHEAIYHGYEEPTGLRIRTCSEEWTRGLIERRWRMENKSGGRGGGGEEGGLSDSAP